jgi:carboxypeptidase Taq
MQEQLSQLKERLARVVDLNGAAAVLGWDQETYMPPGGAQARADQVSTLQGLAHQYFVGEEVGALLDDLAAALDELEADSDEAGLIRVALREYRKQVKVPGDLVVEIARASTLGVEAWRTARAQNDFSIFEPHLGKMVELRRRYAEALGSRSGNLYDALLDDFDAGLDYATIDGVFSALKPPLVELVQAIVANRDAVDDSVLRQEFDKERQMDFGKEVAEAIGYDFERGRLDLTTHPFTTSFSPDDVRITTRLFRDDPISGLMSTIHETGHALYEQNVNPALYRTPIGTGMSMSIHESQSRFYENVLGRSRSFWEHWYPRLQAAFSPQFDDVELEAFYRALNKSEPSLIRVEADEVTYGLHIILRFELENDIFNGRVKIADLPKEWNARMEQYLGVVPPTDSQGVLQDIHWGMGLMGYFPDYLLGSIFSVQLWEQMQADRPGVTAEITNGQYDNILAWLREHVHRHGCKFTFPEAVERITGGALHWEPYMDYLKAKYGQIYGL